MIDILLATYNSSQFLEETIKSLFDQHHTEWRLLIRDGGSEDKTPEIIKKYTQQFPGKIVLFHSAGRSGTCENFSVLLSKSSAPYVMFCDHDDIWLPDKISKSLSCMKEQQQKYGDNTPLLVFTDKRVVDQTLAVIDNSYFHYQNLNPANISLNRLLVQNVPSGCTMLINRALADLCRNIPKEAFMHDHWVSLTAAAFGHLVCLDEVTILYRQNRQNVFGASKYAWRYFIHRYRQGGYAAILERFYQNVRQARGFYDCYKDLLDQEKKEVVREFASLKELSWLNRRKVLLRHRIFKTGLRRNLGMFLWI